MSIDVSRIDRATALQTLNDCTGQYRVFDSAYCQDVLNSLRRDHSDLPALPAPLTGDPPADVESGEFTFYDYKDGSEARLEPIEVYVGDEFLPHPAYEICTPAARSIKVGEDGDYMALLPFADDPTFDFEPYNEVYDHLAWQVCQLDPALEIIAIEVVQRLLTKGMDPAIIDKMGLFFPSHLRPSSAPAFARLGRLIHRRDFPKTLPVEWNHILQSIPAYRATGPAGVLTSLMDSFCHNPNCVTGYCSIHFGKIPPPLIQPPSISSTSLAASAQSQCGDHCFLISSAVRDINLVALWSEADEELLETILGHSPDALPCDLAVICRKPCSDVFKYRSAHFGASWAPKKRAAKRRPPAETGALTFEDNDAKEFNPRKPCSHSGHCDDTSDCKCSENNAHCTRSCRCDHKCKRQWKGCRCASKSGRCGKDRWCPCRKALRECDPRVCRGCTVRFEPEEGGVEQKANPVCCNMAIHLGLTKRTKVRRSKWGLGLFITEDAKEGDLILEYTGELIYEPTVQSREHVSSHRGRAYLFDLNVKQSVDSSVVGNEARYINHDSTRFNCQSTIRNVLGEHRIGFFATKRITQGSEILINYGPKFFKEDTTDTGTTNTVTHATPRVEGQSVGEAVDRSIEEEDTSDMSYQPSLVHSGSGSGSQ